MVLFELLSSICKVFWVFCHFQVATNEIDGISGFELDTNKIINAY